MRHPFRPFHTPAALSLLFAFGGCSAEDPPGAAAGGAGASAAGATSAGAGGATAAASGNTHAAGSLSSAGLTNGGASGAMASGGAPRSEGNPVTGGSSFGAGALSGGTSPGSGGTSPGSGGVLPIGGVNGAVTGGTPSGSSAGGFTAAGSGMAGLGGSSQGGATMNGGAVAVSFLEVENIIGNNCAGCHVDERPILTTTGTALYDTLLSTVVKQCGNHKLVVPNDPTNSAVIELVTKKCNGFIMPTSCTDPVCLVPDEFAKLTTWISLGAKRP